MQLHLLLTVVPEFAAVLIRIAVTVKVAKPSAKKVIAQKLKNLMFTSRVYSVILELCTLIRGLNNFNQFLRWKPLTATRMRRFVFYCI